jgi:hypothetical protein
VTRCEGLKTNTIQTLFSTSFINASLQLNKLSLELNSVIQGVIYAILTISLTAVTLWVAHLWSKRMKKQEGMEIRRLAALGVSDVAQISHISL